MFDEPFAWQIDCINKNQMSNFSTFRNCAWTYDIIDGTCTCDVIDGMCACACTWSAYDVMICMMSWSTILI